MSRTQLMRVRHAPREAACVHCVLGSEREAAECVVQGKRSTRDALLSRRLCVRGSEAKVQKNGAWTLERARRQQVVGLISTPALFLKLSKMVV